MKFILTFSILVIASALQLRHAVACSPAPGSLPTSACEASSSADNVYAGRIVNVRNQNLNYRIKVRATRIWKGKRLQRRIVVTPSSSAACGFDQLNVGQRMLFFTVKQGAKESTNHLTGTKDLTTANRDIKELNRGCSSR